MMVKKGDLVTVITGKDEGRRGKVLRVMAGKNRVYVEGVNLQKKHRKPSQNLMQGGILSQEGPIDASNVMVVCPRCHAPTRTGRREVEDGQRVRVCRRCGEDVDRA